MIESNIIDELAHCWESYQSNPHRSLPKRSLPEPNILKLFVEAVFFASLREEEGRPIRFSVVLVAQEDARAPTNGRDVEIATFEKAEPFSAASIAKLAPAFDPNLSSLAVSWNAEHSDLAIWGAFSFSQETDIYTDVPVRVPESKYWRPDFLTAANSGRGAIVFSRGGWAIGRFADGHLVAATPGPFTSLSLGKRWYDLIARTGSSDAVAIAGLSMQSIEIVLREGARRGHGGTIAVIDATEPVPYGLFTPKIAFASEQLVWTRIQRCVPVQRSCPEPKSSAEIDKWKAAADFSSAMLSDIVYRRSAHESLQRLAQLAAIDGALIINSKFEVISFGAKLTAPHWDGHTVVGPDGYGNADGRPFDVSRYGTRHGSALNFAAASTNSLVFVISQDGPVRAFCREDESTVSCWLDCVI